jgi:DNA-binding NtrC family response regulator
MRSGTLILNEVDALPADDQRRLLLWLDAPREVQVISTTSACMLSRIQAGTFSETLYYRLNIILVDGSLEDREDD